MKPMKPELPILYGNGENRVFGRLCNSSGYVWHRLWYDVFDCDNVGVRLASFHP